MRQQGAGVRVTETPAAQAPRTLATSVSAEPETASKVPRLAVDMQSLRTAGYLPEKAQEREFADHFRRIKRPLIERALAGQGSVGAADPRVIMVASAVPGDGKTFTSINLALSMAAERDISVLLVDSDVAKQHLTDIFGLREHQGLLDALVNESLDPDTLIVPTSQRGLSILPAGRRVENTAELISSNRMRNIMAQLAARSARRIVLLDSPPLLITNEGRAMIKLAGQVALVVRAGETPAPAICSAVELLAEGQAGGLIINQARVGLSERYYGYGAYGAARDEA